MCYTTGGVDCVDVVRFLKLLYMLVCPEGAHIPGRYDDVPRPPPADLIVSVSHMPAPAAQTAHLPRINPVVPSKFKGLKMVQSLCMYVCVCLCECTGRLPAFTSPGSGRATPAHVGCRAWHDPGHVVPREASTGASVWALGFRVYG